MNLVTRCSACGTLFRVVQDQLKVSEGWVRCGRCLTVFDAQLALFDLDRESPTAWQPPPSVEPVEPGEPVEPAVTASTVGEEPPADTPGADAWPAEAAPADGDAAETVEGTATAGQSPLPNDEAPGLQANGVGDVPVDVHAEPIVTPAESESATAIQPTSTGELPDVDQGAPQSVVDEAHEAAAKDLDARLLQARDEGDTPSDRIADSDRHEFADAKYSSSFLPDDPDAASAAPSSDPSASGSDAPGEGDAPAPSQGEAATEETPEFIRSAERSQRWQQPPVRRALVGASVAAALVLALQVVHHERHRLAAQGPHATLWMNAFCGIFRCQIGALQRIDEISIESTALTQVDAAASQAAGSNPLRLSLTLRNRGTLPLAMPAVDLSLTGPDGELVSRRALLPADFQLADAVLKPETDRPLSLQFVVADRRVSGYTVEVFYP